jgi:PhnB protein
MRCNPHLTFDGQCEEAFRFYEHCLAAKVLLMMTYGDSPLRGQTPPEWAKRILHASLELGDLVLTGGDAAPQSYVRPQGFCVLLQLDSASDADRIFEALRDGGTVQMPIQKTFWAERFGMLVDRFGTPWMLNSGTGA